jgi:hypothetical protein
MRTLTRVLSALLLASLAGCGTTTTTYTPRFSAPSELHLRYRSALEIWAGDRKVAESSAYAGLAVHVACVPEARRHAEQAQSSGHSAHVFSWLGGSLAVVGLGGLTAIAVEDSGAQIALVTTGLALEVLGLISAGVGYGARKKADGNALDAVNFYNDAVASDNASCEAPVKEALEGSPRSNFRPSQ